MRATLAGKIKDNGRLEQNGEVSHFLVWALEEDVSGHPVPMQYFPHHLHCYELFVCGMLRRAEMETLCQKDVWISLSLPLSHFCVCVRVCLCVRACYGELWQTKLDSVGGVNSITIFAAHFWIWISPSSKANHMQRYWKRFFFVHARLNIYMCRTDAWQECQLIYRTLFVR